MKSILRFFLILAFVFASCTVFADANFDKMKTLVGEWEGKAADGQTARVKYELISSGTAVMEKLEMPDAMDMVSIYHLNGDKVMMTHYCAMNNQPRFEGTVSGDSVAFRYVDATNLADANAPHITGLVLTFKDADHMSHAWSTNAKGDAGMNVDFTRKK